MRATFLGTFCSILLICVQASAVPPAFESESPALETVTAPHDLAAESRKSLQLPLKGLAHISADGISGTVAAASGAVIRNATITAVNNSTGGKWVATSDAQGSFVIRGLEPGSYSVTVEAPMFQRVILASVIVSASKTTVINPRLLPVEPQSLHPVIVPPKGIVPPVFHGGAPPPGAGKVVDVLPAGVPPPPPPPPPSASGQKAPAPTSPGPASPAPASPGPVQSQGKPAVIPPKPTDQVAAENKAFEDWHKKLPYGLASHHAQSPMILGQDSTVTFTIRGQDAPPITPNPGDNTGKLQVSPYMSVYLTQPENPDGFKIVESDSPQNPKPIAPDGSTTWTWTVTPQKLGPLKLHIEAFVLKDDKASESFNYQSYDDTIEVRAVTLWGYLTTGFIWVLNNPAASLKWILPGGAGAAMIGKLIHWLATRKKKPTPDAPDDKGST